MTEPSRIRKLSRPDGESIAHVVDTPGREAGQKTGLTGLTWLGGFRSDMTGTKAEAVSAWARETNRHCVRFDYFGHGASSGLFREGTIGRWKEDALAVIDNISVGPQILIGSSMGAWIAILAALERRERVAGLVLIAPAPDFTEELMWKTFPQHVRDTIRKDGVYLELNSYSDEPNEITRTLIEEGRRHLVLGQPVALMCPVRILQGMADPDVPWSHAMRLVDQLVSDDIEICLSKKGDHRLSTPADLDNLVKTIASLCKALEC